MIRRSGFTLIELLIVVAIIAILAAIAVPNFLEAQTRSRVSRAQNDMRTISLAMESYRLDNNSYPLSEADTWLMPPVSTYAATDRRLLSTPVSYIADFPRDVFMIVAGISQPGFRMYAVSYPGPGPEYVATGGGKNPTLMPMAYPKTGWMTWSLGPDGVTNTAYYYTLPMIIANEASNPPAIGKDKNGNWINPTATHNYMHGMRYDPTNGTVSWGDIYRFGGDAENRTQPLPGTN